MNNIHIVRYNHLPVWFQRKMGWHRLMSDQEFHQMLVEMVKYSVHFLADKSNKEKDLFAWRGQSA